MRNRALFHGTNERFIASYVPSGASANKLRSIHHPTFFPSRGLSAPVCLSSFSGASAKNISVSLPFRPKVCQHPYLYLPSGFRQSNICSVFFLRSYSFFRRASAKKVTVPTSSSSLVTYTRLATVGLPAQITSVPAFRPATKKRCVIGPLVMIITFCMPH